MVSDLAWAEATADTPPPAGSIGNSLRIERETHKLEKRLCRLVGQAIIDYNMISSRMTRPGADNAARDTVLSSSRMLPGQ